MQIRIQGYWEIFGAVPVLGSGLSRYAIEQVAGTFFSHLRAELLGIRRFFFVFFSLCLEQETIGED